jgi:hypothetical protein
MDGREWQNFQVTEFTTGSAGFGCKASCRGVHEMLGGSGLSPESLGGPIGEMAAAALAGSLWGHSKNKNSSKYDR